MECRPVRSYEQIVRYLLKYMLKEESNSATFDAITKACMV